MIRIRRSAIVRHSCTHMFNLVNEVEAYPRRFNWCSGAHVLAREPDALTARLDLRLGAMTQSFTTRNTLEVPQRITMQLVEGPFRALHGGWTFTPLGDAGCKIALALDFDYSGLMSPVLRAGFQKLADRMVDEFCREADREHV
ncbi:MAG: type II toxin-antitoxin system RatA family toxin [Rudaea sp.]|uniref:type II toxin-antitoxin system RatA family toxin n=1 Tax=unclassified Rudaea TaxID=2627037 RepID=UPI0010F750BA|nr:MULTISPECIES: type II toxin-antitoxin system RatA family toxin [unclassified Rudaea]MBN8884766.1 type II toxin-antitoxin system RatA family toxin [Rudaea sp.]